jgi:hypothetical protein
LKQVQNIPETVNLGFTQTLTKKSNKTPQNLSEKNQTLILSLLRKQTPPHMKASSIARKSNGYRN